MAQADNTTFKTLTVQTACREPVPQEFQICGGIGTVCEADGFDVGLGTGRVYTIQTEWITEPGVRVPEVWVFVAGKEPYKLASFTNGAVYRLTWDIRMSFGNGTVFVGLRFLNPDGSHAYWVYSNGPGSEVRVEDECVTIDIVDFDGAGFDFSEGSTGSGIFREIIEVQDSDTPCYVNCFGDISEENIFRIRFHDCCLTFDCSRPYDNSVFCEEWYNESKFNFLDLTNPGLTHQVMVAEAEGTHPTRAIALTRSADAFDENLQLQYGSSKWMMVWDLELNRLIDCFPKAWLRHGASMYYQNATLQKEIKSGYSSRRPYYIEEVDLGLVFNPQGSYKFDRDSFGQRVEQWDVPSRLIGLPHERQQRAIGGWGQPDMVSAEQVYAEFNHVSVDTFQQHLNNTVEAQRERFFRDRELFLDHTARQRFHDQIMFLQKEVAEKMLRQMHDMVEQSKHLNDIFNPESTDSFGHYMVVILNHISNKLLRTKNDRTQGLFNKGTLENDEESLGDWSRYVYGELRRLVELEKIDKKDVQGQLLAAIAGADIDNPQEIFDAFTNLDMQAIREQYELAGQGRIPAGAGLVDPNTLEENRIRGLAK